MFTRRQRLLALLAFIALSVPRRSRPHGGDAQSHVSRSLRKQLHSKPRCRVRQHRKSTTNARRSPSSRTPGLKSDAGSGNFGAEGKRKQAWKLGGPALVTTSSGCSAYAARWLTQLSLLHKQSQCSRYGRRSEAWAYLTARLWAARNLSQAPVHQVSVTRFQTGSRDNLHNS